MPARQPSPFGEWLVLVLAAITGYVAWQIAPLTARMDAVERDQLATKDDLLAQLENFAQQLAALERKNSPPAAARATSPSETPPPPMATPPSSSQSAPASPPDIARSTNHSVAFVLARGRQIEEMLATARDAPPDLLQAIRQYLKEKTPQR